MPDHVSATRRRWQAVLAIAVFALLPPLTLVLPAADGAAAAAPQRLIVWLPQEHRGDLPAAAATLDAA
ncbi:hypothetical protein, partial [Ferrovibrio sp.]